MKKTTKHRLTAREVQTLGPGKHADGGGLYLIVEASGTRRWLFRYTAGGKRRDQGFGSAAKVSLARAREKAAEAHALLARGIDPLTQREEQRAAEKAREAGAQTFGSFADAWFESSVAPGLRNEKHVAQWKVSLSDAFCSSICNMPISLITTEDVLAVLKPIWMAKPETASRLRARLERVLDAATVAGARPDRPNPARWRGHLSLMLPPPAKLTRGHHAALPWEQVPALMTRLHTRDGVTAAALRFVILTAARAGEALGAKWAEIDLEKKVWVVPAERMKAGREQHVPITTAAMTVLEEMQRHNTGEPDALIFPGRGIRPMGPEAFEALRRRMGGGRYTTHGFRSSFRDWAGDATSAPREVAEGCLAHAVGNKTELAYRRGDALEKRRLLLQQWADFCLGKASAEILPFSAPTISRLPVPGVVADGPESASA
jgi:integrase